MFVRLTTIQFNIIQREAPLFSLRLNLSCYEVDLDFWHPLHFPAPNLLLPSPVSKENGTSVSIKNPEAVLDSILFLTLYSICHVPLALPLEYMMTPFTLNRSHSCHYHLLHRLLLPIVYLFSVLQPTDPLNISISLCHIALKTLSVWEVLAGLQSAVRPEPGHCSDHFSYQVSYKGLSLALCQNCTGLCAGLECVRLILPQAPAVLPSETVFPQIFT